jgi:AraC-like DNA-binding protein
MADLVTALDLALRGGVCTLLLLIAAQLIRSHGAATAARLGALFALGAAAHTVVSTAGFRPQLGLWAPILVALANGANLVFWLFARALFDDGFRLKPWHAAAGLALMAVSLVECTILAPRGSPLAAPVDAALTLSALGLAILAAAQTVASWRDDLIEQRRRLRVFIVGGSALYMAATAVSNLASGVHRPDSALASLASALGLAAIAGAVAWSMLRVGDTGQVFDDAPAAARPAPASGPADLGLTPADQALVAALEQAMTVDRLYRRESLTIGALAEIQGLPEYRLRRLINQGLGHRNFNSFLNRYRLDDTLRALADPGQAGVPILTIALDAGFNSLGPFNRAFKAATGLTPSEYRRARGGTAAPPPADFKIGEPVSISVRPSSISA